MVDNVNHPKHYKNNSVTVDGVKFEPISLLNVMSHGNFAIANACKYLIRYKDKNGEEDLRKARWYLNNAITNTKEAIDPKTAIKLVEAFRDSNKFLKSLIHVTKEKASSTLSTLTVHESNLRATVKLISETLGESEDSTITDKDVLDVIDTEDYVLRNCHIFSEEAYNSTLVTLSYICEMYKLKTKESYKLCIRNLGYVQDMFDKMKEKDSEAMLTFVSLSKTISLETFIDRLYGILGSLIKENK